MKTFILCLCLISITIAVLVLLRQVYIISKFFPKTIVNPFSLSMLVWYSIDEEVPTEEKQYLCRVLYDNKSYFKVLWWSNDISKVDKFGCKGQGGFYEWHPEIGYHEAFCDYWQEISWREKD